MRSSNHPIDSVTTLFHITPCIIARFIPNAGSEGKAAPCEEGIEENVQTEEIQLASLINQLQNTNPMSNTEAFQWAAEADDSFARNEILTDDEIIRTVTAEDDDDDDVIP
ncbi:hypothetical protein AVEN_199241-1 [Araneus ventricosus]|uniref:DDE-1 domain-containing protein n=1 Tax=Araneus ventricosus TaxID=182803 RepID=A0A4Y2D2D5_ARAVE|nr:hypothetical protein AVEN_199241-1 [Araneus ventricosus]